VDIVLVCAEVMIELDIVRKHRIVHKGVESNFPDIFRVVGVFRVISEVPCGGKSAHRRGGWRRVMMHGGSPWVIIKGPWTIT
jgi:hypothetical protein